MEYRAEETQLGPLIITKSNWRPQTWTTKAALSILMAIFPGGTRLASTRMSPFWILLEVIEVEVVAGAMNRCAKLQSYRYHQQNNT